MALCCERRPGRRYVYFGSPASSRVLIDKMYSDPMNRLSKVICNVNRLLRLKRHQNLYCARRQCSLYFFKVLYIISWCKFNAEQLPAKHQLRFRVVKIVGLQGRPGQVFVCYYSSCVLRWLFLVQIIYIFNTILIISSIAIPACSVSSEIIALLARRTPCSAISHLLLVKFVQHPIIVLYLRMFPRATRPAYAR
jgi:hypothetical protein